MVHSLAKETSEVTLAGTKSLSRRCTRMTFANQTWMVPTPVAKASAGITTASGAGTGQTFEKISFLPNMWWVAPESGMSS